MDCSADSLLVARLLERDEGALKELIDLHGPMVLGVARRVLAEPSLAEEVAQDTFVALWRRPGAYDPGRGSLRTFLLGVARNKAIDLVRREEARRRAHEGLQRRSGVEASTEAPASERIEEGLELRRALEQLSDAQREALTLAYFGGRTYREVAKELGIPEGTAKTRLRDGLIRLRELLGGSRENR